MKFDTIRQFLSYAADNFGLQILQSEEYKECIQKALDESQKWHQRECPLKAPFMMWFVFSLMLYRSLSIVNVLKMLLQQFRHEFPSLSLNAITPEATCHARSRLGSEPMRIFFENQAKKIKPSELFHNLPVWSVDGTTLSVPDTPANEARFGRQKLSPGKSAYPQMGAVSIIETSTRQVGGIVFTPCNPAEREGVFKLLAHLKKNVLLLMDRGISAIWIFAKCQKRSLYFLARISVNWKPEVIKNLGPGDSLVAVSGETPKEFREKKKAIVRLTLRMIKFRIGDNEPVRLLTNLLDEKEYPASELAKLYHSRWESEIVYDELKNHLPQRASGTQDLLFRSKNPDGVIQEAYALVSLYNMIRRLMAEAGKIHNVNPLEISFVDTVQVINDTTPRFQAAKTSELRSIIFSQMLKDISECQNSRPRRPRQYPRVIKKKICKFKVKRKDCCQKILNIDESLKLGG